MSGELILVVDDNEKNRRLVHDVLAYHGFTVHTAATAADGLTLARTERPRLVLLDIQLPDMSGETVLRCLRDDPETAGIPLVAVTAYAMRGDRERFLDAGFDAYLAKPFDVLALPEQVRRFCAAEREG